ncbi:hypothetical protein FisN_15Hh050 [Fistulifera solaris]|uniref:Uncharacterized protein n=1 Tax=Fistulifera solaris TaxID=1519565 RepID=A0A1Z5K9V8_FISSO|nr:hypothetical protein FisN_15Hh050 [Fistulifera solaris]|eukprot:GAX23050.1 hypothetical protein FisN_15Hh050 [Fistulifera solaris]
MKSFSLLFALLSSLVAAQNETNGDQWGGCQATFSGASVDTLEKIEIGKQTIVCFHVGNTKDWARGVDYIRLSFQPEADQYSRMHIPNSFNDLVVESETVFYQRDVTIAAAAQDKSGFLRVYYDAVEARVFPYLTAIIDVKDGMVRGVTWDDSCVFCSSDKCPEITYDFNGVQQTQATSGQPTRGCEITEDECNVLASEGKTLCDLTIYVVWTGTDANGVAFQSSASRFSRFPPQELSDRVSNALPQVEVGGGGETEARAL